MFIVRIKSAKVGSKSLEYPIHPDPIFGRIGYAVTLAKNVWPLHSKSARSQVLAALPYIPTVKFVWARIGADNMRACMHTGKSWRLI